LPFGWLGACLHETKARKRLLYLRPVIPANEQHAAGMRYSLRS